MDELVRPQLRKEYEDCGKSEFLATSKYQGRTSRLFKAEFQGNRSIALTSKCYYVEDNKSRPKISSKGISKKQNPVTWTRYLEALQGCIDMATNMGFHLLNQKIVT